MNITIICVGKIKEKYLTDAIKEYSKRLSKYCKLNIIEVADEKTDENASDNLNEIVKDKEGERILKNIKDNSYIITLEIGGKMLSSEELAGKIDEITMFENSNITFIIGGSLGLSKNISNISNYKLSFSKMTFPHQLMRVILLEQIYRSFRILKNEPYHK
ncbi:MAG: 23S rRNA (pseudouridine(1915)-N(3))-methyltransferase RlmH [Lachnospiraceae bacterium]|nr:23S rRNA (pseudouridine(1915)-N(3))-methyltransferase RlmH [Lachnospiraceae bacterium]